MAAMAAVVEVSELRKTYVIGSETVHALGGVSLPVERGRFVAVMGASGSGKSTLLHLIGGLDVPTAGRVVIEDRDIGRMSDRQRTLFRRRRLGVVFQTFNLLPTLTAEENVALPWLVDGQGAARAAARARELLGTVDMEHRLHHRPEALSGGEQQRLAIARAVVNRPTVLIADEPTGNLDTASATEILEIFADFHRVGVTVVVATHDQNWIERYQPNVLCLDHGRVL